MSLPESLAAIFSSGLPSLRPYFTPPSAELYDPRLWTGADHKVDDWITQYEAVCCSRSFPHDEPWLTIVALYGLFGDQSDLGAAERLASLNALMDTAFPRATKECPDFRAVTGVHVEVCLPENLRFRRFLREPVFSDGPFHPYSDRLAVLQSKLAKKTCSLEGNTKVDALVDGNDASGRGIHLFIEAKFLSDISKDISYLPVRNQIARIIDCAIESLTEGGTRLERLDEFWFALLTPGMFRTPAYGGPVNTPIDTFSPWRGRLYCYKMDDYLNPQMLRSDLPHWDGVLSSEEWEKISRRIGWLTFEDVVRIVSERSLLPAVPLDGFIGFFRDRGIVVPGGVR